LYYTIDEPMIPEMLRWLNKAAAKERRLLAIKDNDERWRAAQILAKTDPLTTVGELVNLLNFADRNSGREARDIATMVSRRVNKEMRECLVFPQIRILGDGERARGRARKAVLVLGAAPGGSRKVRAYREIVSKILYLYVRGHLSRVRQCEFRGSASFVWCGKWFYAKHGKSRFHSDRCRNRAHYANLPPKSKKHRREKGRKYMRKYRADEKEKTERELQRAKERN
jgi:hypothetical protein